MLPDLVSVALFVRTVDARSSEPWFDSEEDLVASLANPEDKTLLADLPNLTDPNDMNPTIAVEYRVVCD
jgi:hypothetical protein